jgi:hypothetical protein
LIGREPLDVDAVRALQVQVAAKRGDAGFAREQEQIAVGPEVDGRADALLEMGQQVDRLLRELDVRRIGELMAEPARIAAGGHRPELRFTFDEDDVCHPALGEVIRNAGAHAAAADDHYFC